MKNNAKTYSLARIGLPVVAVLWCALASAGPHVAAQGQHGLERAIAAEDKLNYIEPADWYLPVRETLGAVYFLQDEPALAEKVFRDDLDRNRRNGRALFGLAASLKAQGEHYAAELVQQEFEAAWRNADVKLRLEDY
jgi:hypothetical protein